MIAQAVQTLAAEIADLSAGLGRQVVVDGRAVLDRTGALPLQAPGLWSPNGSCRLVQAADGWIAVNLARESDLEMLPAWIGAEPDADPWAAVVRLARDRPRGELAAQARLLGMPVAMVGEVCAGSPAPPLLMGTSGGGDRAADALTVVDLSTLWAGPLCGGLLARMGARVTKVSSLQRPETMRKASPDFYNRLNGDKAHLDLDFSNADDLARLRSLVVAADLVITSARSRAFEPLGLSPTSMLQANPRLIWVAITGYGWEGDGADRVAFGDDAAAAGGLLARTDRGEPRFLGDALADPLTGLAATAGALRALKDRRGGLLDAALARTAAGVVGQAARARVA